LASVEVTTCPLVIVAEPDAPVSDAVHVLLTESAVAVASAGPTLAAEAELVTDPPAPVVPWVLTFSVPVSRMWAGPACKFADGAVSLSFPPVGGSVTDGVGARVIGFPPKMVTLPLAPTALPVTEPTSAEEGPAARAKAPALMAIAPSRRTIRTR
jgi:hypothetical protein